MTETENGKKDILEFPLEDVEVPQAIALMMQAASKSVTGSCDEQENVYLEVDNDRLQLLCEKLEARVQDAIEDAVSEPVVEDAPDEPLEPSDIHLMYDETVINYKGLVFHRNCNTLVVSATDEYDASYCALPVDHKSDLHVDEMGNTR